MTEKPNPDSGSNQKGAESSLRRRIWIRYGSWVLVWCVFWTVMLMVGRSLSPSWLWFVFLLALWFVQDLSSTKNEVAACMVGGLVIVCLACVIIGAIVTGGHPFR